MKNFILALAIIAIGTFGVSSLTSCNFTKQAVSYVQKHCPKTEVINPLTGNLEIHYQCDSLWPTQKIQEKCNSIQLCIDAANGQISGTVQCPDLIQIPPSVLRTAKPKQ